MRVVVPFDAKRPKTRLESVLAPDERDAFARAMLRDVVAAGRGAGHDPEILSTAPVDVDGPIVVDERELTPAVNGLLDAADLPVAIVMADLALATPASIELLIGSSGRPTAADDGSTDSGGGSTAPEPVDSDSGVVVVAPGRGGGTNALVVDHPDFRVDYHGASIRDHRRIARAVGADLQEVDSMRLSTDVDEPADLVEVLLHADGEADEWLREAGFDLVVTEGRVGVARHDPPDSLG